MIHVPFPSSALKEHCVTKVLAASFLSPSDAEKVGAGQIVIKWNFSMLKDI